MGLRLVGLLPCAVWTPKVPKPTIAGQARAQNTPYPTVSNCSVAGSNQQTINSSSALQLPVNRLINNRNSSDLASASTSCRCSTSSQPRSIHTLAQQISTNRPSSTITSSSVISTVARAPQPIRQLTPNVRPITASSSTSANPMLLVPFAAVPGFVPIQGQTPVASVSRAPPTHAHHIQAASSTIMQPPPGIPLHQHQNQSGPSHQIQHGNSSGGNCNSTVLLTPTSCTNGNAKVK